MSDTKMSKKLRMFEITLRLRGPILVQATSPTTFGVDDAVARDASKGKPCVPGSLIKGKVREALWDLEELASDAGAWFGSDVPERFVAKPNLNAYDPDRGALVFEDLVAVDEAPGRSQMVYRVALEHELGSAKGEALRVIEAPYGAGKVVAFTGTAYAYLTAEEASALRVKLEMGLRFVPQIGSLRTTGFGRVEGADVKLRPVAKVATVPELGAKPAALRLAIAPRGPLCVSRHKIGDNLFESEDFIPGNVLLGAVAQTAEQLGIDIPDLDRMRVRHAFPAAGEARPRALPLSTVKAGGAPYDVAGFDRPILLAGGSGEWVAPAFPVDWKEHGDVLEKLGWAFPERELRVRTRIDGDKRTADRGEGAEGGKLFAIECIHPWTSLKEGDKQPIAWLTQIDLEGVTDPRETATKLAEVLGQLGFVGKLKTRCEVAIEAVADPPKCPELAAAKPLVLALQAPALLVDPRFQNGASRRSGALSADEMLALYRDVFTELSGGSLALSHHFAQQQLAGGNYLANRFQARRTQHTAYDPWLLTREGSVFAFEVKDAAAARDLVSKWLATGLPLPQWAKDRFGTCWTENPYRPENGFGEIALHEPVFAVPDHRPIELVEDLEP